MQVAPDNVENREAYVLVTPHNGRYTLKAGQMFLPFGLRLQDDDAFVRQASGVNFRTPEDGVELGLELPKWSTQLAVTSGAEGNGSDDRVSLSAAYVQPRWRVGASRDCPSHDAGIGSPSRSRMVGAISTCAAKDRSG